MVNFLKTLSTVILTIVAVACILSLALYYIIFSQLEFQRANIPLSIRGAEKLIADSIGDTVVWQGVTFEKSSLEELIREARQDVSQRYIPITIWLYGSISLLVVSIGLLILLGLWFYRCNKCKNWFAIKKGSSKHIHDESMTRREETGITRSEKSGDITERHYSNIEYSRAVYRITFKCKHCGHSKFKTKKGGYSKAQA
jgi:hypothetical protein